MNTPAYAELAAATNFSFLRGASHPQDMVLTALLLGQNGIGIADRNTVAGVVRAHGTLRELRDAGEPPIPPGEAGRPHHPSPLRGGRTRPQAEPGGGGSAEDAVVPTGTTPTPARAFDATRPSPQGGGKECPTDHPAENDHPDPTREALRKLAKAFKLVVGARLAFADGTPDIIAYPVDRPGWGRLCRLLTLGNRRAKKGDCILHLDDLLGHAEGLLLIVIPERRLESLGTLLERLVEAAPGSVWLAAAMGRGGGDRRLARLRAIAERTGAPLLAINDALYAAPEARDLQDVLTCLREGVTIETAGRLLEANAERHLKPPAEMARLFRDAPEAIAETQNLLARIDFTLDQLKYEYPDEPVPLGWTPQCWLEELTWRRAALRYPDGIPEKVETLLRQELALIAQLEYAPYFLTIHDIVRVAEDKGILCQGRGSAANSAVCYALGITAVDPAEHDVLFARFISTERREPPDIDVDFEHERREEIIQHIYERYGRERAGIAATTICYRPRSAMREVGKALGLSEDITARFSATQWGSWDSIKDERIRQAGLDPRNPLIRRAIGLARRLLGFPRHLSQHVGGFVLTRGRLDETVPIGNAAMEDRTFIEWNKDDIDELKLMKVDVLGLGMLTCIRKAFDLIRVHTGTSLDLSGIQGEDDDEVYRMLQRGESLGVFQVESRAQMNMLPRLKPRCFYDLVIQVAIVRPGPIQGDMVHPYLRRRANPDEVEYPSPSREHGPPDELHHVLHKTLGVPLFQEQAMRLAIVAAKFSDSEANQLRRAMATFRNLGTIGTFEVKMVDGMVKRGYDRAFAQRCFEQIKGFGSYGFPESHAASFAKLVYVSSWIKHHHPAAFAAALLNSQPMGFYAPAQIVIDAKANGVEIRPVDVNHSFHDNTLERTEDGKLALRLGFRQVEGIGQKEDDIAQNRGAGYPDIETLRARTHLPVRVLRRLADADAFRSMGLDRRDALWAVRRLPDDTPLPLFAAAEARELGPDMAVQLPEMSLGEHVAADYQTVRLSLKAHPMTVLRPLFRAERIASAAETSARPDGTFCRMAGIVLVRQRPGKGNAIFVTLEDETGITNVVMWASVFERFRAPVMSARLMLVEGRVQKSPEGVVHLMARRIIDRSRDLSRLSEDHSPTMTLAHADEFLHPQYPRNLSGHPRNVRLMPKSRDFH